MKAQGSTEERAHGAHGDASYGRLVQQLEKTLAYVRERASSRATSSAEPCSCGGGSIVGGLFRTRHAPARCNACWVHGHYSQ
jgi:hypothetical protein